MKITVDHDPDLYRALKVEATRADRGVRDVIAEAIDAWLIDREEEEEEEDVASAQEALRECERDGGTAGADCFTHLAAAALELRHLPPGAAASLRGPILALALEPRPPGATRVRGSPFWRFRIGMLRIVCMIDDDRWCVVVLRVARRSESTYRRIGR